MMSKTRWAFRLPGWGRSADIAIDLGTANTCVYVKHRGIVLNEPSIVAVNSATGRVEAVGHDAKRMLGRTPANIMAIKPMQDGVIADFTAAESMLTHFIRKVSPGSAWITPKPRVIIGAPSNITQVERRAVRESALRARAREVFIIEESMAAAVGAGLPITEPRASMVVDIGGGTTDIAVISMAGVVRSRSLRIAGNELDEAIIQYVRKSHSLLIGDITAETVKTTIGSVRVPDGRRPPEFSLSTPCSMEVKGRHLVQGVPRTAVLTQQEIGDAIEPPIQAIVEAVRQTLEHAPPELAADLVDAGLVLAGGGALLRNLDWRLQCELGIPVRVADDPLSAVVRGVGAMLHNLELLRRVSSD